MAGDHFRNQIRGPAPERANAVDHLLGRVTFCRGVDLAPDLGGGQEAGLYSDSGLDSCVWCLGVCHRRHTAAMAGNAIPTSDGDTDVGWVFAAERAGDKDLKT